MEDRRTELLGWIAKTERNRKRLARVLGGLTMVSLVMMAFRRSVGFAGLAIVAVVALCGFWILSSHIAEWRGKLDELARPRHTGPIRRREPD